MKKIIILFLVLLLTTSSSYAAQFNKGTYDPNGETITVIAKGLVCEFCAKALEKVFMRRDDVSAINVDLTSKEIKINLKDGESIDDDSIKKLIQDAGYNIAEIIRSEKSK